VTKILGVFLFLLRPRVCTSCYSSLFRKEKIPRVSV